MLERLADLLRAKDSRAGFEATPEMLSITGMTLDQFADLMGGLGYAPSGASGPRSSGDRPRPDAAPKPAEARGDRPPEDGAPRPEGKPHGQREGDRNRPARVAPGQAAAPRAKRSQSGPEKLRSAPPRAEKPIDPDNPFAVLAALKGKV
jgi:ATP-dependent RNA helicase SUPV3L1/SUV3